MEPEQSPRTDPRGAWLFAIVVVVVAIIVVGLFLANGSEPECAEWEDAKAEWVTQFPPIQRETKSDEADFQGFVEVDGERTERPDGC